MLQFFKFVLATIVGLFFFMLLMLVIFIGIGSAASSGDPVKVEANSVLKLKFDKPIVERSKNDPLSELNLPFGQQNNIGLIQLREAIANAKLDDNIKGIFLEMDMSMSGGYATIEEIRNALLDFKESGKFIVAFGEYYTEKGYYLASVADSIYVHPVGGLEFNGISAEMLFLKGTLDKLEIKPEVFKVGEYKSAVEPFLLEKMSEPSREQTMSYLNSINNFSLQNISKTRNIPVSELKKIEDSLLIREPEDALKYKLITHVAYYDQVASGIRRKLKIEEDKKINFIGLSRYSKAEKKLTLGSADNRIAVIVASGDIQSGKNQDEVIGSEDIAEELRKVRLDKKVKAVVLRINSPGGSALASDVMWREVIETRKVKPVIASMSDLAASGGYYMAMGCDTIVANPNTITGSIGIFAVLFNVENFLKNKLGITTDNAETSPYADLGYPTHPVSEFERKVIQTSVERGYDIFTTKAAQGRDMPVEQLRKIASGRVWSGLEAKENGLVDILGGLDDAIKIAAKSAKIDKDYRVRYYPAQKTFLEELFTGMNDEAEAKLLESQFGAMAPYVKSFQKIQRWEGIQARLPFDVVFK
ncbi:signal peptide peptidase SppA [Rhodocytophaga aerolata]|uniref:Signal peptide peptidase SppA n=1 Tax=Rhodocytophaga aerolata TaxID=455078 RepID=A0ABT8RC43_9BACT|nr:signal peptide peptidase SppA [Rhodocytophaga aerolata]MDO1448899.1 signal peptide peptidase SppA [Rhodocytophaga aerolata]